MGKDQKLLLVQAGEQICLPVSYTHLDVYKRQGEMYALSDIMAVGTLPDIPETPDEPEGGSGEGGDTQTPET